jgi:hypothetical protein
MVTYRLSMVLKDDAASLYTIFGTQDSPMIVPPAMQIGAPFGAHIGGVNPVLIAVQPSAAADSWLSVGITDGDSTGALSAIGIDFLSWTATSGITVDEGAIFWLSPADAPGGSVTMAQLTIPAGDSFDLVLNAQGRPKTVTGVTGSANYRRLRRYRWRLAAERSSLYAGQRCSCSATADVRPG